MADAAANLPEEEKTLRALLRALRTCLVRPRERAEKIVCLDLDNYRLASDEDEGLAQTAFDDDVDHAEEVLEWRAIVVADLAGEAMARYARAHSPLDDPWMAWRIEPLREPGAELVHGLNEEEFFCARVAYHIHSNLDIRRPSSVPTDGDLEDIPDYLEIEHGWTWRDWLEVLGPPQKGADLKSATASAKHDVTGGHTRSDSEVGIKIAELADQVSAFQMPTIERLESIGTQVDAQGAPNRFKAEEFLREALGVPVYSSLSDDARTAALDAERRFRDLGTLDWNSVVSEFAKAFEIQVKQRFVLRLAQHLKQKDVLEFPEDEYIPNRNPGKPPIKKQAIIKYGKALPMLTFGMISMALTSERSELKEFSQSSGVDLSALKKLIDDLNLDRNKGAHETRMSFAEAARLREDWLGIATGDGGIFGALLPKG
jgi:hypothetical protein